MLMKVLSTTTLSRPNNSRNNGKRKPNQLQKRQRPFHLVVRLWRLCFETSMEYSYYTLIIKREKQLAVSSIQHTEFVSLSELTATDNEEIEKRRPHSANVSVSPKQCASLQTNCCDGLIQRLKFKARLAIHANDNQVDDAEMAIFGYLDRSIYQADIIALEHWGNST